MVLLLVALGGAAVPSAARDLDKGELQANAYWGWADATGCIYSSVGVAVASGGQVFVDYSVYRAHTPGYDQCPEDGLQLVSASGSIAAGGFTFDVPSPSLKAGTLEATVQMACAGPLCPSAVVEAHVSLTWEGAGRLVKSFDDAGNRLFYRYGTASGEVLFEGVDLVAGLGPSDLTETNLVLKLPPS